MKAELTQYKRLKTLILTNRAVKLIGLVLILAIILFWAYNEIMISLDVFVLRFGRSIIDGLAYSMLLFLMVSGFFIIFGLCDVINFAHGAFFMLGGFIGLEIYLASESFFLDNSPLNDPFLVSFLAFVVACIGTAALLAIIGAGIEIFTIRRYYGQVTSQILLTIGFMFIIAKLAEIIWGAPFQTFFLDSSSRLRYFFLGGVLDFGGGLVFEIYQIFLIIFGFLFAGGMFLVFQKTRFGLQIQAGIEDSEMVEALGINITRLFTLVFMAGAALSGLAGIILVPWLGANTGHGTAYLIFAFVIVVVGGAHYGRFEGTFFGALIVGMSIKFCEYFFSDLASIIVFIIMSVVLVFKPGGLTGES